MLEAWGNQGFPTGPLLFAWRDCASPWARHERGRARAGPSGSARVHWRCLFPPRVRASRACAPGRHAWGWCGRFRDGRDTRLAPAVIPPVRAGGAGYEEPSMGFRGVSTPGVRHRRGWLSLYAVRLNRPSSRVRLRVSDTVEVARGLVFAPGLAPLGAGRRQASDDCAPQSGCGRTALLPQPGPTPTYATRPAVGGSAEHFRRSPAAARARWECCAFQPSPSSATVCVSPSGTKIGS